LFTKRKVFLVFPFPGQARSNAFAFDPSHGPNAALTAAIAAAAAAAVAANGGGAQGGASGVPGGMGVGVGSTPHSQLIAAAAAAAAAAATAAGGREPLGSGGALGVGLVLLVLLHTLLQLLVLPLLLGTGSRKGAARDGAG